MKICKKDIDIIERAERLAFDHCLEDELAQSTLAQVTHEPFKIERGHTLFLGDFAYDVSFHYNHTEEWREDGTQEVCCVVVAEYIAARVKWPGVDNLAENIEIRGEDFFVRKVNYFATQSQLADYLVDVLHNSPALEFVPG